MAITGKEYVEEVVRLADLFTVDDMLQGYSFERCLLVGPGIVAFSGTFTLSDNVFAARPEGFLWSFPDEQPYSGLMHFRDSTFVGCRFVRIGFAGDENFRRLIREQTPEVP